MTASWRKFKLELTQSFVLSYGSFDYRSAYIVTIEEDNVRGFGEATAITYYGWSEEKLESQLENYCARININESIEDLLSEEELLPPIRNAIQCAWVDMQAMRQGISLREYYQLPEVAHADMTSITISGSNEKNLIQQIQFYNWPTYKIKMGGEHDDMILSIIENHPTKLFRIDANAGWNLDWVEKRIQQLKLPNIELIEQPFKIDNVYASYLLKDMLSIPIYADESCQNIADVLSCAGFYSGVNIKLMKCGGWDKALPMIDAAKSRGMEVMIGCMTETSIGISHAIQISSLADKADVDGAVLIRNDPAEGSYVSEAKIYLNERAGSGGQLTG